MKKLSILFFVILTIVSVSFAQKGKTEKKIVKTIDQNTAQSQILLEKLVNINSGTMNLEGVQMVGKALRPHFEKLGFEVTLTDGSGYGRAGHLIATRKGKKGPKILMIGHLDTVFEKDSPFQKYEVVNDSIVKGPGIADMKGGDVIILMALQGLYEAGVLDDMSIQVVMTGDEEKSGSPLHLSKEALVKSAEWADIALGFENADGDPKTIVVARRGSTGWSLKVKGNAAHSSQVFTERVGVGAIYETSRILNAFYKQLSTKENLTFNPGVILGGTKIIEDPTITGGAAYGKSNVVAQEVVVKGDIRAVSLEQLGMAKKEMMAIAGNNYNGTTAELVFEADGGYPPLTQTKGNVQLLELYNQVSQDLGFGKVIAVNPRNAGAADISFTSGYVGMAIDGMGLSGDHDHTINEFGIITKLPQQAKRAAVLMYRLSQK